MARRRKRRTRSRDSAPEADSPRGESGSAMFMTQPAGILQMNEVDEMALGVGNVSRLFTNQKQSDGIIHRGVGSPYLIWRHIAPFSAFTSGFSASSLPAQGTLPSNDDPGIATDNTVTIATTALYPISPAAQIYVKEVWPVLSTLLQSGLGTRHIPTSAEVIRYLVRLIVCYIRLRFILNLNYMTYHFDWSTVYPGTSVVPPWLYAVTQSYNANDIGIAENFLPLMQRLEQHTMFPGVVAEVKRMMAPTTAMDLHPRVVLPYFDGITMDGTGGSSIVSIVSGHLDYIDTHLSATYATLHSLLPFPISGQEPWTPAGAPLQDPLRWSGAHNSGVAPYATFGNAALKDAKIPDQNLVNKEAFGLTTQGIAPAGTLPYDTRMPMPLWGEVFRACVWLASQDTSNAFWVQASMHEISEFTLIDGAASLTVYKTSAPNTSAFKFLDSKWIMAPVLTGSTALKVPQGGIITPGYAASLIGMDAYQRMLALTVEALFNVKTMRQVAQVSSGQSLREIRFLIAQMATDAVRAS